MDSNDVHRHEHRHMHTHHIDILDVWLGYACLDVCLGLNALDVCLGTLKLRKNSLFQKT
jgi:hypothetical protein